MEKIPLSHPFNANGYIIAIPRIKYKLYLSPTNQVGSYLFKAAISYYNPSTGLSLTAQLLLDTEVTWARAFFPFDQPLVSFHIQK